MSELVFDLGSTASPVKPQEDKRYVTAPQWESRDAYLFVVSRLGKYIPWDPKGWPDEVADLGCRCKGHSFMELWNGDEPTGVWVCTDCSKPKPLMNYVEWCVDCGIPYVVRKSPDRIGLCSDCGG